MIFPVHTRPFFDRMIGLAFSAFLWWIEGLRLGLPPRLRDSVFRTRERLLVRARGEQLLLRHVTDHVRADDTDEAAHDRCVAPGEQVRLPDGADVVLVLPREARLTTELDVPRAAESELRSLIYHELDRLTPFPISGCVFDYHVCDAAPERSTLRVEVALARRRELDELVERVSAHAIVPTEVTADNAAGEPLAINLLRGKRRLPFRLAPPPFQPLLAAVAFLAALAAAYLPLGRYAAQLEGHEAAVEESRAAAVSARAALDEARAAAAGMVLLEQRRREYERPLDLLAELTSEIPADTWISRLSISGERIEMQGESNGASTVLEVVESLDSLESAEFQAPVARNDTSGKERFSIAAARTEHD